jgi:hypothetical protein
VPDGKDLLKIRFLVIRYASFALIFTAVVISLLYGGYAIVAAIGPLLLLGALGGSLSLHLGWAATFRTLYGLVTVMSAFWAQLESTTPFYIGWAVLLLGMAALLLGGVTLETGYLASKVKEPGPGTAGLASLRRVTVRIGTFLLIVTVLSLMAVLSSFAFALGAFPIWAVAICTAVLVLLFAYLVSKSAERTDQSG